MKVSTYYQKITIGNPTEKSRSQKVTESNTVGLKKKFFLKNSRKPTSIFSLERHKALRPLLLITYFLH